MPIPITTQKAGGIPDENFDDEVIVMIPEQFKMSIRETEQAAFNREAEMSHFPFADELEFDEDELEGDAP